jgi:hypothetical protein
MKRILSSLALAAGLSLTAASVHAQWSETHQPCASTSPSSWCITEYHAQCTKKPSATEAVTCAVQALNDQLVGITGVACGPCSIPDACTGSISNLTSQIQVSGPFELQPGEWAARAIYAGCFNVSCSLCDA